MFKQNKLLIIPKILFYFFEPLIIKLLKVIFPSKIKRDTYKNIPIIINSYNRLSYLKEITNYLAKKGYNNIYILDNASTYPPLLKFYKECSFKVIYLKKNYGYLAFWKSGVFKRFIYDFHVYTDPDIIPVEDCPHDFLLHFYDTLVKYKKVKKVGFSLKIDDLPDHYKDKNSVIEWEKQFYEKKEGDKHYIAQIDTTFALYRPWSWGGNNRKYLHLRASHPYMARHLPWYEDSEKPTKETLFYVKSIKIGTHWSKGSIKD